MVLVDTSIWIAYLRACDPHLVAHLQALLEEDQVMLALPVKMEILCGSSQGDWPRLRRVLGALPLLIPSDSTWKRIEGWIEKTVSKGARFGVADLLIAALAADWGAQLWSLDIDFRRMQDFGFIRLHLPS